MQTSVHTSTRCTCVYARVRREPGLCKPRTAEVTRAHENAASHRWRLFFCRVNATTKIATATHGGSCSRVSKQTRSQRENALFHSLTHTLSLSLSLSLRFDARDSCTSITLKFRFPAVPRHNGFSTSAFYVFNIGDELFNEGANFFFLFRATLLRIRTWNPIVNLLFTEIWNLS